MSMKRGFRTDHLAGSIGNLKKRKIQVEAEEIGLCTTLCYFKPSTKISALTCGNHLRTTAAPSGGSSTKRADHDLPQRRPPSVEKPPTPGHSAHPTLVVKQDARRFRALTSAAGPRNSPTWRWPRPGVAHEVDGAQGGVVRENIWREGLWSCWRGNYLTAVIGLSCTVGGSREERGGAPRIVHERGRVDAQLEARQVQADAPDVERAEVWPVAVEPLRFIDVPTEYVIGEEVQ
ncbi:hypothetical protein C8J57DRAFT_1487553 [Mycena rebaudengoi]|nr:hypothetical protein C8J57DRAFT_1487553 [Mycena rebaudengoi]